MSRSGRRLKDQGHLEQHLDARDAGATAQVDKSTAGDFLATCPNAQLQTALLRLRLHTGTAQGSHVASLLLTRAQILKTNHRS